mmetsp:Transcript_45594/g.102318  ORF Transcript_45594/g.102318 Transcript_45594/m.102318 type:complete len:347 (+) Transcript_45594:620-1660(+)
MSWDRHRHVHDLLHCLDCWHRHLDRSGLLHHRHVDLLLDRHVNNFLLNHGLWYRNGLLDLLYKWNLPLLHHRDVHDLLHVLDHWNNLLLGHLHHNGHLPGLDLGNVHNLLNSLHHRDHNGLRLLHWHRYLNLPHLWHHHHLRHLDNDLLNLRNHLHHFLDDRLLALDCLLDDLWPLDLYGLNLVLHDGVYNGLLNDRHLHQLLLQNDLWYLNCALNECWLGHRNDLFNCPLRQLLLVCDLWHLHNLLHNLGNLYHLWHRHFDSALDNCFLRHDLWHLHYFLHHLWHWDVLEDLHCALLDVLLVHHLWHLNDLLNHLRDWDVCEDLYGSLDNLLLVHHGWHFHCLLW